jgi:hypothetical protein
MAFYEVIYEDGSVSVADYASDEEATSAVMEQHNRAKSGQKNGPQDIAATRVARVLAYGDQHPGSLYESGGMPADEVKARVADLLKGHDVVDPAALAVQLQTITHPMQEQAGPHDSRFKMESDHELKLELA